MTIGYTHPTLYMSCVDFPHWWCRRLICILSFRCCPEDLQSMAPNQLENTSSRDVWHRSLVPSRGSWHTTGSRTFSLWDGVPCPPVSVAKINVPLHGDVCVCFVANEIYVWLRGFAIIRIGKYTAQHLFAKNRCLSHDRQSSSFLRSKSQRWRQKQDGTLCIVQIFRKDDGQANKLD